MILQEPHLLLLGCRTDFHESVAQFFFPQRNSTRIENPFPFLLSGGGRHSSPSKMCDAFGLAHFLFTCSFQPGLARIWFGSSSTTSPLPNTQTHHILSLFLCLAFTLSFSLILKQADAHNADTSYNIKYHLKQH